MKRTKFALALLAAFAAASQSVSLACERCKSACKNCSSARCDDRGLLDLVDDLAGRMQTSLQAGSAKASGPCKRRASGSSGCDAPSCGCESRAASTPSYPGTDLDESWTAPPPPKLMPADAPHSQPPAQASNAPQPPSAAPLPTAPERRAEPMPLQDQSVDPFKDDSARRVRPLPASPVQYRRPASRYGEQYDPQASNEYRVRLSDDSLAAQVGTSSPFGLERLQSSRRPVVARPRVADAGVQAVVTASSISPLQPIRSARVERLPSRSASQPGEAQRYENPLRPHQK